jgi:hypothetical protein
MIGVDKNTTWKSACPSISTEFNPTPSFEPDFTPATENLNSINEFFDYFIDEQIVSTVVQCTNERLNEDDKVNEIEIKGYIGLLLLFGVTKKHDIEIDEMFNFTSVNHMDWATVCMSRNRFKFISARITFDDITTRCDRVFRSPKLHKINQLFDHFNSKLQKGILFL